MSEVTHILHAIEQGAPQASEQLLPLVYEKLRKLNEKQVVQRNPGQTGHATLLLREAHLRTVPGVAETSGCAPLEKVKKKQRSSLFFATSCLSDFN